MRDELFQATTEEGESVSKKLTEWFPARITPTIQGVYMVRGGSFYRAGNYQHWDGYMWGGWAMSVDDAKRAAYYRSARQRPEWRGLAENPEA